MVSAFGGRVASNESPDTSGLVGINLLASFYEEAQVEV